jgi:hypothetical protein
VAAALAAAGCALDENEHSSTLCSGGCQQSNLNGVELAQREEVCVLELQRFLILAVIDL